MGSPTTPSILPPKVPKGFLHSLHVYIYRYVYIYLHHIILPGEGRLTCRSKGHQGMNQRVIAKQVESCNAEDASGMTHVAVAPSLRMLYCACTMWQSCLPPDPAKVQLETLHPRAPECFIDRHPACRGRPSWRCSCHR